MDEFKSSAGGKFDALSAAAKDAANTGKNKISSVYEGSHSTLQRLKQMIQELWRNDLVVESRARVGNWWREAARRMREGDLPLSPLLLYQDLITLLKDRIWRRSALIFCMGVVCGGSVGLVLGARYAVREPGGPHCRALHSHSDGTVLLVEDAVSTSVKNDEVLVRVQAFSVCPVDRAVLRGRGSYLRCLLTRSQVTVGRGFAGVVLDVGRGVPELEMGDEVWGCVSEWSGGAASELLTIRYTRVSRRPRGVSADVAASLPWAGSLMMESLGRLAIENFSGKRIVLPGANSGEGCVLLQILSNSGAYVSAASTPKSGPILKSLGASEIVSMTSTVGNHCSWDALEKLAASTGPWDAALICTGSHTAAGLPPKSILRATAPRWAIIDLRPYTLFTDKLFTPVNLLFATTFTLVRTLRWMTGMGFHTDFLEQKYFMKDSLKQLADLVEDGKLKPVMDKVYGPQDFEVALAHACSDESLGTTVIRFP